MPQEAWVVKCYSCHKFQVQLKKKSKKWKCVVCGAKQDLMIIFFKGEPSACRVNVQSLNAAEGEKSDRIHDVSSYEEFCNYSECDSENIAQNLQSNSYTSFSETGRFEDEAIALANNSSIKNMGIYYQEKSFSQEYKISGEDDKGQMFESFETHVKVSVQSDTDSFDLNSMDFSIKIYKSSSNSVKKQRSQPLRLSIFESNNDFDECLDF